MKYLLMVILGFVSVTALARYTEDATLCYTVNKQGVKGNRYPCLVINEGGTGFNALTYKFAGHEYTLENDYYGDTENFYVIKGKRKHLQKPYQTYTRGYDFKVTKSDNFAYFCYKSKMAHFCAWQGEK